ncbi:GNAT family N-acetyltransferase [Saccharothrix longispora]|uniref:GNAT family N-acetyltransferase n=1 Tax=Saccharothrix longispora TaxID=33920 RepID=UPI0028FD3C4C|nr:GNAT family N-acetyltransferase [Saccharothrix longispora]MDU0291493.1 GNAT family N-acetyltransferase [Saccharothrix longispora]
MADVVVRPAREDEWAVAGEVTVAAYRADRHVDSHTGGYADVLVDARTRAAQAELLVAVDVADTVLGTVTVVRPGTPYAEVSRPGEVEFRMLAVSPGARGRGVGEALVLAVVARARELGARRLVMSSSERMLTAHRLYRRLGFRRLPERDWLPVPGTDVVACAFSLELA